ncbi:MAG: hypothetical protein GY756_01900 [bacterium]|nr:hypothetical protein [bacterium]
MIINLTQKKIISNRPLYANSFTYKLNGLRKKYFKEYDAVVFQNCNFIHTVFTLDNYDIVFATPDNKICKIITNIKLTHPAHYSISANSIVCLQANIVKNSNSKLGDIIDLNAEISKSYKKELLRSNPLISASVEGSFIKSNKE